MNAVALLLCVLISLTYIQYYNPRNWEFFMSPFTVEYGTTNIKDLLITGFLLYYVILKIFVCKLGVLSLKRLNFSRILTCQSELSLGLVNSPRVHR